MIERVLLDMDGVLVDFVGGVASRIGRDVAFEPGERYSYFVERIFGVPSSRVWAGVDRSFWSSLRPLPWMGELIDELEMRFGAQNVCLLTSPVPQEGCLEGKLDWIREHLPNYRRRFLIGPNKEFCASPTHVLIDDRQENVDRFRAAGGQGFAFPAPWNANYTHAQDPLPELRRFISSALDASG